MEIDFVNEVGTNMINYFTSNSFKQLLSTINILLIISVVCFLISLIASLYYFYKKEGIKEYYAFIPFYNVYHYFKIIRLPYYLVFIPIVNLITLYLSGYKLAEVYRAEKKIKTLSLIVPIAMIPYMIFSNKYELYKPKDVRFLKNVHDVDLVEERLERESQKEQIYDGNTIEKVVDSNYESKVADKINTIEQNAIQDDVEEQLLMMESNKEFKKIETKQEKEEAIIDNTDIQDLFGTDLRLNTVDNIDIKVEEASKKKIVDNAEYKEYKEEDKDVKTIAFGGTSQDQKIENARMERKDTGFKCPHCGSELSGSNGICPGCGKDVSSIVFEKSNLTTVKL